MSSVTDGFARVSLVLLGVVCFGGCGSCGAPSGSDSTLPASDATGTDAISTDAVSTDAVSTDAVSTDAASDSGMMMMLSPTGAACADTSECEAAAVTGTPLCIPDLFGFPDGYCTNEACNPSLADCPGDGVCEMETMGDALCLDACDPMAPDCRMGYTCFDASLIFGGMARFYCLPLCNDAAECNPGEMCDNTGGMPSYTCFTGGAAIGDACVTPADCDVGQFCLAEDPVGLPGGYCTADCNPMMMPGTCPAGSTCVENTAPDEGLCLDDCMNPASCRAGYDCSNDFYGTPVPGQVCVPACTIDAECTIAGWECEVIWGLCQLPLDPMDFGGPCAAPGDCAGGACLTEADWGAPYGYCVDECDPAGMPSDCPTGGTCIDFTAFIGTGLCYTACDPTMPMCRTGYSCPPFGFVTDACVPDCNTSSECESACCQAGVTMFQPNSCVDPGGGPPPPMCL